MVTQQENSSYKTHAWHDVADGFFGFFGFISPAKDKVEEIIKETPTEKIARDISRVNSDYKKAFLRTRKRLHGVGK